MNHAPNPAELAAQESLKHVFACIRDRRSFKLEAGAGAGKTYSLIEALKLIIREQGGGLLRSGQQVACITYTNVATDEIKFRTDNHPAVRASTIHAFCWDVIRDFQSSLRKLVPEIPAWLKLLVETDNIDETKGIAERRVEYDLGHRRVDDRVAHLHHDDVISLTVKLMAQMKFRRCLTARYPVLFIDEYQDTNKEFCDCILSQFIASGTGPLIGLFGDSWQKIYGDGCGHIEHEKLCCIEKKANFRSVKPIVDVLNRLRPELTQSVKDPDDAGSVIVFHSNDWRGSRLKGSHWKGDLPTGDARAYLEVAKTRLESDGWDFSPQKTRILMLTHKLLATEQNYSGIAEVFKYNESFVKKENSYIAFLVEMVEPACVAYIEKSYGKMLSILETRIRAMKNASEKATWKDEMDGLIRMRTEGTIGDVIDYVKNSSVLHLPEQIRKQESELARATPEEIKIARVLSEIEALKLVPYREVSSLANYLNQHTPFATKHGVKGAEFENVLVVFGRGWSKYNWSTFLELAGGVVPIGDIDNFENNRNLFYVVCSRPKKRLALLFTQELSSKALATLDNWFGKERVQSTHGIGTNAIRG